jgi:hypothetical protein
MSRKGTKAQRRKGNAGIPLTLSPSHPLTPHFLTHSPYLSTTGKKTRSPSAAILCGPWRIGALSVCSSSSQ